MLDFFKTIVGPVGSIAMARGTALTGLLLGAASQMDWTSIISQGPSALASPKQALVLGGIFLVHGLVNELVRRANDPVLDGTAKVVAKNAIVIPKKKVNK